MLDLAIFVWAATWAAPVLASGSGPVPAFYGLPLYCGAYRTSDEISYPNRTPIMECPFGVRDDICFKDGGFYSVNLQLSLAPGPAAEGSITIDSPRALEFWDPLPSTTFVLTFKAGSAYTLQGNTVVIQAQPQECFRLNYTSTANATINPDSRASRLTIHKLK